MRIEWSPLAIDDRDRIFDYYDIDQDNPRAAVMVAFVCCTAGSCGPTTCRTKTDAQFERVKLGLRHDISQVSGHTINSSMRLPRIALERLHALGATASPSSFLSVG